MLIRRVERGDVIVIPKGVVFWWYNDGFGRHRIFSASDTARAMSPGIYQAINKSFLILEASKDSL